MQVVRPREGDPGENHLLAALQLEVHKGSHLPEIHLQGEEATGAAEVAVEEGVLYQPEIRHLALPEEELGAH